MYQRITPLLITFFTLLFVFVSCEETEPDDDTDGYTGATSVDTLSVTDSIRYPDFLVDFLPAPGQFVNASYGLTEDAEGIIGGIGLVSLGGYGGYITVGFNAPITNDSAHNYGVDFTVIGNAYEGSSEPGIVMVMQDKNNNGIADEEWYELQGAEYQNKSTYTNYEITYYNTNDTTVIWKDNLGESDTLLRNGYHSQSYYPSTRNYASSHPDSITFTGTKLTSESYEDTTGNWINPSFGYGYADNNPLNYTAALNEADNPYTEEVEGCGADAFDLDWAIDANGESVEIDSIYFIKIYCAVADANPILGEVSTEIRAIIPVE